MPYIQPAAGNIFGLNPVSGLPGEMQINAYAVSSSEATAILPGDAIVRSSIGTLRAYVATDTANMVGVAAHALTTGQFAAGTRNLLVYDDPEQHYVIGNTTSASLAIINIGMNVGIVTTATGTGIPSTLVGRSKHAISATVTSSAGVLRIIGLHPIETYSSTPAGALKWIVKRSPASEFVSNLTT